MIVGSLFTGIGGIDLGLERAGMRVAWQCERNDYCRAVLDRHWPDVPCYPDVHELGSATPRVDVLAGGFPCQPVSTAGKRRGQDDERWLWPEFARMVGVLRPRFVLVENVTGLLTRGMGDVLGDLAACGYDAEWDCLPACAIGASHERDRVWIVAYPNSDRLEGRLEDRSAPRPTRRSSPQTGDVQDADRGAVEPRRIWGRAPQAGSAWWWAAEPDVGRVAHGVPRRLDRLEALGNAVVPQVAEWIGRRMMEAAA